MQSNRYSCTVLIKLFLGILSINIQIKLHEKRHSKSRVVLYGQTDGRTDGHGWLRAIQHFSLLKGLHEDGRNTPRLVGGLPAVVHVYHCIYV